MSPMSPCGAKAQPIILGKQALFGHCPLVTFLKIAQIGPALFRHASVSGTYPCQSVGPLVTLLKLLESKGTHDDLSCCSELPESKDQISKFRPNFEISTKF